MADSKIKNEKDLPDLIDKIRNGLSVEQRLLWYPRLPKIVVGLYVCMDL